MHSNIPPVITVERTELREVAPNAFGLVFHVRGEAPPFEVLFGFPSSQVQELHSLLTTVIDDWCGNSS